MTELLPCPFCSSPAPLLHRAPFAGSISGWRVSCNYCDTSPGSRGSEAAATDLWNTRWGQAGWDRPALQHSASAASVIPSRATDS